MLVHIEFINKIHCKICPCVRINEGNVPRIANCIKYILFHEIQAIICKSYLDMCYIFALHFSVATRANINIKK